MQRTSGQLRSREPPDGLSHATHQNRCSHGVCTGFSRTPEQMLHINCLLMRSPSTNWSVSTPIVVDTRPCPGDCHLTMSTARTPRLGRSDRGGTCSQVLCAREQQTNELLERHYLVLTMRRLHSCHACHAQAGKRRRGLLACLPSWPMMRADLCLIRARLTVVPIHVQVLLLLRPHASRADAVTSGLSG